jgi:hypothetical protein
VAQLYKNKIYGEPFLCLIRSEVETLVSEKYRPDFLKQKQQKKELAEITFDFDSPQFAVYIELFESAIASMRFGD